MWANRAAVLLAIVVLGWPFSVSAQRSHGSFLSKLQIEPIPGTERDFQLLSDFAYRDPQDRMWTAPKGAIVDGASIPRAFRLLFGGPWDGRYKEASVIHDHFCKTKSRPWQDVHRSFYSAMRANGVDETKAKLMFAAVYRFGPRWTGENESFKVCSRELAEQRAVSFEDTLAMCNDPRSGRGRLVWMPEESYADWASLVTATNGGAALADIETLVTRQLDAEPEAKQLRARRLID